MKSFSIIIPSFNSMSYIKATIDALVALDYDKNLIEVIIVDDGSTDDSFNYINNLISPYPWIKQIHKPNSNWGGVLNYVKKHHLIKHEIVSVLDSDDQYLGHTLKLVDQKIGDHDIFAGAFYRFNGHKKTRKFRPYWFFFKRVLTNKKQMHSPYCLPLPYFFKSDLFNQLEDLRENVAFQDPDFLSQMIQKANSLIFSKKAVGLYYYKRPNNSRSVEWDYEKRFEPELYACYRLIANGASECVSYRLNVKSFAKLAAKQQIRFEIPENLQFKWFPWFLRWIYWLIFLIKQKKFFKKVK